MLKILLAEIPETYRLAGELFGKEEQAEALAKYAEKALNFANSIDIPESERISVYYGNGLENLETSPRGSSHAELLEIVKAANVAVVEGEITTRIDISAEQIIGWDPQVIILNGEPTENFSPDAAAEAFVKDVKYKNVSAVKTGSIYAIPKYPYSWFDRPPGPNRLIGIYWLTDLLYGDKFDVDIKTEAKDFYKLFYHMDLTDAELNELLGF